MLHTGVDFQKQSSPSLIFPLRAPLCLRPFTAFIPLTPCLPTGRCPMSVGPLTCSWLSPSSWDSVWHT
ncbi:hypothetical protein Cadr_000013154 [Camelus dromedarius]|uniref:Uncharacterized protein n=1 Tax=Camelus dromedarius TaxID=9838 RepID=A0A5N4DBB7_CAMDR|nr:hypothetical protein Cadr_000013154 [Camelus dromedarius]